MQRELNVKAKCFITVYRSKQVNKRLEAGFYGVILTFSCLATFMLFESYLLDYGYAVCYKHNKKTPEHVYHCLLKYLFDFDVQFCDWIT